MKKIIPIRRCISFTKDRLFEKARQTLKEAGIEWMSVLGNWDNQLNELKKFSNVQQIILPAMDTVCFHPDRFEVLIDARGYRPEDIKCTITPNLVEVVGQRVENFCVNSCKSMSLSRTYQLPQPVRPEDGNCCLSSEGVLLITAPWRK